MVKVIIFNGPPGCGKDFSAEVLSSKYNAVEMKLAQPLKDATHALHGLDVETDHFEVIKDEPSDDFFGMTPREAYINMSELAAKPAFGHQIFGLVLARNLPEEGITAISDGGFIDEVEVISQRAGSDSIFVIRIYREGCSFKGDSRSYICPYELNQRGIQHRAIFNDGTEDYCDRLCALVDLWLGDK